MYASWLDNHFDGEYGVTFPGTDGVYPAGDFTEHDIGPGHPDDGPDKMTCTVIPMIHEPMKAYDKQVGGNHYKKLKIQPMQYSMANKLDACQHTAIKYITRHQDKAGKKDLYKSLHTVLLLIEEKYEWTDKDAAILEAVAGAMGDE
jgi:hypothetical protein